MRFIVVIGAFVTGGALAMAYLIGWLIVPTDPTKRVFFDEPEGHPQAPTER